jgi:RHS repeat-associated protein
MRVRSRSSQCERCRRAQSRYSYDVPTSRDAPCRRRFGRFPDDVDRRAALSAEHSRGVSQNRTKFTYGIDRYYDPSTDQFLSVDPLVAETGQPYAFTGDDPLNATDPDGMMGTCGGQSGDCVQNGTGGHPVISNPQTSTPGQTVPIVIPGPTATFVGGYATVSIQPSVTISGPNPSPNFSFTVGGGISLNDGQASISGTTTALEVLGQNCDVQVAPLTFQCTVNTKTVQEGLDKLQGQVVATGQFHNSSFTPNPEAEKVGASAGALVILWWLLKPICAPAGPLVLAC